MASAEQRSIKTKIRRGIEQLDRGEGIPDDQLGVHLTILKANRNESADVFLRLRFPAPQPSDSEGVQLRRYPTFSPEPEFALLSNPAATF